jgi:molybdate transport system ATP-binding protein
MNAPLPRALAVELKLQRPGLDIQSSFRVPPGQVCALVGPTGGGKTAVMQAAAGLLKAQGGRITVGNEVMYDHPTRTNRPPQQRRFAWLDSQAHLFPHMTVQQNLHWAHKLVPEAHRQAPPLMDEVLEWLSLKSALPLKPAQLSGLLSQKVALARALVSHPNALMLRDPLAHLEPTDRDLMLDLLAQATARYKIPTVFTSPRMREVIRLADDVVVMHEGRVASAGPLKHILSDVSMSTFLEGLQAGSVIEGTVRQHDIQWLLTEIDVVGQRVSVPALLHGEGQRVRLKIRARDVNIHLDEPQASSASNQLRARITQVMLAGENGSYGAVAVELLRRYDAHGKLPTGNETLWALLTRRSIQQMQLVPGMDCHVSFKAMAVQVASRP